MNLPPLSGALRLPDGTPVRGRSLRSTVPAGPLPDLGLYLSSPGPLPWPSVRLDWPDFRTPRDPAAAAAEIRAAFARARAGKRVEVGCRGGRGRTGTVLACFATLGGLGAADAVEWVRQHHHRRAVETRGQRRWVADFAAGRHD